MKIKLSQDYLKKILNYDSDSGVFTWVSDRGPNAKAGCIAGTMDEGYIRIVINNKSYRAHRLAWLYVKGYFPENGIDHIDMVKHHNWIDNLREVSQQCNMRNTGMMPNNKSGVKGVHLNGSGKKWRATVKVNYKTIHLGYYYKKDDAVMARWLSEKKYNFSNCKTDSSSYLYLKERGLV